MHFDALNEENGALDVLRDVRGRHRDGHVEGAQLPPTSAGLTSAG